MKLTDPAMDKVDSPTILIVEDESITAMDIRGQLLALGYSVAATASSGEEAVTLVHDCQPDIVLMDVVLKGGIDGIEAARRIHSQFDIPVIYLTAFSDGATLKRAKITEPFGYILKPFDERDLHTTIEMALYKHRTEKRFKAIIEGTEAGYVRIGSDGRFEEVNASWLRMHGYESKEEIIGQPCSLTQCASDADMATNVVRNVLRGEVISSGEFRRKCKDGSIGYHSLSLQPVWQQGTIVGLEGFLIDITERKRAHLALQESEERFRSIAETIDEVFWMADVGLTQMLYVSPGYERVWGRDRRSLYENPRSFLDAIHPDDLERVRTDLQVERTGQPFDHEYRLIRPDGTIRWIWDRGFPVRNGAGEVTRFVGVAQDVTARKHAEANVARLRKAVESSSDVVFMTNRDGLITFVNPEFTRLYGYAAEEILGKATPRILKSGMLTDEHYQTFWQTLLRNQLVKGEVVNKTKDGCLIPVESSSNSILDERGNVIGFVAIQRDITERKRTEEELRQSAERQGLLLRSIPMVFYTARAAGRMETTWISDQVEGLTGFSPAQFVEDGSFWSMRLHPDDRDRAITGYESTLQKGSIANEYRWLCADGTHHWFLDLTVVVHDDKGIPNEIIGAWLDITDRKKTEQELVESRFRLAKLNDCLLSFGPDPDENINRLVALCGEQLGGTAALYNRLDGENLYSLGRWNVPDDYNPLDKADGHICYDVIHRKQSEACVLHDLSETPYAATDPNVRHYGLETYVGKAVSFADTYVGSLCVVYNRDYDPSDEDLKLLGIAASAIGVEEKRKHAEEGLRQSEHQFRLLFMENPHPMYVHDLETLAFLAVNDAAVRHYGYSREEFLSMTIKDIRPEEDIPALLKDVRETSKGPAYSGVWRHRKKDGAIIFVEISSHATLFAGRRAKTILAIDITTRKRAEEQIAMLGHTIRSISEAVSITDLHNKILFINDAFLSLYGYHEKELIGNSIELVRSPVDHIYDVQTILEGTKQGGWHGELMNRKKDGTDFPVSLSTSVVYDDKGQAIALVGVAQDITERRQAERDRVKLEEQLLQAQKLQSLGTLAGGIAHDFNNLLGIILGHITLLGETNHAHPKFKERLQSIAKAADRGAGLVRQLLTFARKADTRMESVNINDSVREVSKLIAETFPKTITMTTRLEPGIPPITADSNQIHQVLVNLCVNARDAMLKGGELVIATRLVPGESIHSKSLRSVAREYVLISVADTGMGMDEPTLSRVFEPFFTTKTIGKGTGLGLAVVFGIMESHNGFVEVSSEVGRGSCFNLYFPVASRNIQVHGEDKASTSVGGGSETILLVEDEVDLLDMVTSVLTESGYTVITASDGIQAVERYEKSWKGVDLVITDMGLPKLDGREVFERMRAMNSGLKAVVASGYIEPDVKLQMLNAGARDFIQKPYRPQEILRTIRTVLDRCET